MKLIIGDKNFSSWSMRAWLVARASKLPFEEVFVGLDRSNTAQEIRRYSPSGRVPCLIMNNVAIWDSLAICETIAECAPSAQLWPKSAEMRAVARSYVAEMHSGFASLRNQLSMDIRLRMEIQHLEPGTLADIRRILELWKNALVKSTGPFLFGEFGIADAFYAPVVFRFLSYGIQITDPVVLRYMNTIQEFPLVKEWVSAALKEEPVRPQF